MNRADRRAVAKAIRRGHAPVSIHWPRFPSELLINLLWANRYVERP